MLLFQFFFFFFFGGGGEITPLHLLSDSVGYIISPIGLESTVCSVQSDNDTLSSKCP